MSDDSGGMKGIVVVMVVVFVVEMVVAAVTHVFLLPSPSFLISGFPLFILFTPHSASDGRYQLFKYVTVPVSFYWYAWYR